MSDVPYPVTESAVTPPLAYARALVYYRCRFYPPEKPMFLDSPVVASRLNPLLESSFADTDPYALLTLCSQLSPELPRLGFATYWLAEYVWLHGRTPHLLRDYVARLVHLSAQAHLEHALLHCSKDERADVYAMLRDPRGYFHTIDGARVRAFTYQRMVRYTSREKEHVAFQAYLELGCGDWCTAHFCTYCLAGLAVLPEGTKTDTMLICHAQGNPAVTRAWVDHFLVDASTMLQLMRSHT